MIMDFGLFILAKPATENKYFQGPNQHKYVCLDIVFLHLHTFILYTLFDRKGMGYTWCPNKKIFGN